MTDNDIATASPHVATTTGDLTLRFVSPRRLGQIVRLPASKCSIGSGENCTLRLAGTGIHPVHCFIVSGPGGTVVRRWSPDTRLNGRPFRDAALQSGDRLSLGPVELEVVTGAESSPTAATKGKSASDLAAKQQELDLLRDQLCQTQVQLDAQSTAHIGELESWENQRRQRETDLAAAHEQLRHESERFAQQLHSFGQVQAEWHVERDELVARCARLQTEVAATMSLAEEASATRHAVTEMWSFEQMAKLNESQAAKAELQAAEEQLAERTADFARQQAAWQAQQAEWHTEAAEREAQLDRLEGELKLQQCELSQQTEKLQHARESLEVERAALQEGHRQTHNRLAARLAELDTREAELSSRLGELAVREAELTRLQAEFASQSAELSAQRGVLQTRFAELHTELAQRQAEMDQTAATLAQQRGEFDAEQLRWQEERHALAAQLDEQEGHVAALQQELVELRSVLDAQSADEPEEAASPSTGECEAEPVVDAVEVVAENNAEEPASPAAENDQSNDARLSEAMLALQRLREAAISGGDEDEDEDEPADYTEQVAEEVAEDVSPIRGAAGECDVSIEDYMSQLMQRVRGKSETESPSPKRRPTPSKPIAPAPVTVAENADDLPSDRVSTETSGTPLEALRSLPSRASAQEVPHSLQAMRELANQSARSAIGASSQKRWMLSVRGKFAVSIASVVCGGTLFTLQDGLLSWTAAAAVASLVVAGVFGLQGYNMRRQGQLASAAESQGVSQVS